MQSIYNHADSRQVQTVVNQLVSQFEGTTGTFNLANSVTQTTITNPKVTTQSRIFIQARNANAVSASAFVSSISNGSFVIGHTSGTTTRTFDYVVFGV